MLLEGGQATVMLLFGSAKLLCFGGEEGSDMRPGSIQVTRGEEIAHLFEESAVARLAGGVERLQADMLLL